MPRRKIPYDRWSSRSPKVSVDEFVQAWLRYQEETRADDDAKDDHPDWWAVAAWMDLRNNHPDLAWELIVRLADAATTEWQLVMIGCSPLEDFLMLDPDRTMDRLEAAVKAHPKLLTATACVWLDDDPIRARLDALLERYQQPRL